MLKCIIGYLTYLILFLKNGVILLLQITGMIGNNGDEVLTLEEYRQVLTLKKFIKPVK